LATLNLKTLGDIAPLVTIGALLGLLWSLPASSADVDAAELYGHLPTISMMEISPDGRTIAFRRMADDGDRIMLYSLAKNQLVGSISLNEDIDPNDIMFADADTLVLVVSQYGRIEGFRGRDDYSRAFVYSTRDHELKTLLQPGGVVYVGQSGLGEIVGVSPGGKYAYMPAFSGDARFVEYPNYSLFRVELGAPKHRKIQFQGERRSVGYLVDADGATLVHELFNGREGLHSIEARHGKDWSEIFHRDTKLIGTSLIGLTPDYRSLVVARYDEHSRRRSYYTMSLENGEITGTLFARDDADVESVIADINRVVYGARYSGFNPSYEFLDSRLTTRVAGLVDSFQGNSVRLRGWTNDWKTLLVYVEGPAFSGQYFSVSEGQSPKLLATARPNFDDARIHPIASFRFTARDGMVIPTLLTIPRAHLDKPENLPAIILPHGGPAAYDRIGFDWFAQALADQGYLVVQPQFRGSTGFGLDHREAGNGEWGKKMQSDLTDALQALVNKGYVDADRVCIVGMSYGGYAALAGGAFTPDLYKCVVSINGISDVEAMIDHDDFAYKDNEWIESYFEETIGNGELRHSELDAISPADHAENFQAPVLLLHGEHDEVVSNKQSGKMYSRLKSAGKDVTYVPLEDDNHYLSSDETRIQALREVIDFVNEKLR